ncbi:MAG TPA: PLP-dependent aminotransferase family protein [Solirubrobacteraceae bacterium]|nr:PLP-dependent aminotransferase family protein [Solirubrobacteraceae bacterium]
MTIEQRLAAIERGEGRTITSQLVEAFTTAIEEGELAPGEKLPPTRTLAELTGVNPLTATRCYRRLAELGLVVAGVGRGTFVRERRPAPDAREGGTAWQNYVLPPAREIETARSLERTIDPAVREALIPLSVGYPPNETLPVQELSAAASAVLGERSLRYGPVEGLAELRRELAKLGRRRGLSDEAGHIVVTTGARQALTIVARAILRPGDVVACESPTFSGFIHSLGATGARALGVPVDREGLDVGALRQLLQRHEISLVLLQPRLHNPTGFDLSPARRQELVGLAREHGFFIVEDGVYADLRVRGEDLTPLRALAPEHVIMVDSFSKTVAPGLRIGWVAASGPVLDRIATEKSGDDGHSPTLPQQAMARWLADGRYEAQLARTRAMHAERLEAMLEAVERHLSDLVSVTPPPGGGHVWLTLHDNLDEDALYRDGLAAGVSVTPGAKMMIDRPERTHLRLSFAYVTPAQIHEGVRRLASVIRAQRRRDGRERSMPLA